MPKGGFALRLQGDDDSSSVQADFSFSVSHEALVGVFLSFLKGHEGRNRQEQSKYLACVCE